LWPKFCNNDFTVLVSNLSLSRDKPTLRRAVRYSPDRECVV